MNCPHTATADPNAFLLWPDASAATEEMMVWAQAAAGYVEPGLTVGDFSLDDLDATLAWGQGGTTPAEAFGFQNYSDTNWMFGGTAAVGMSSHGVPLSNASTVTPTLASHLTDNTDAHAQGISICLSGTPSLTDVTSLPSPQSDDTGDKVLLFPTFEATTSHFAQQSGLPFPQLDITGDWDQITCALPTRFMEGGNFAGQVQSDFGTIPHPKNTYINTIHSAPLDYTQLNSHPGTPTGTLTTTVTCETVPSSLGKRSRQSDQDDSDGLKKRARSRVPGGAEFAKRIRRSPATRTRSNFNSKPKAAERGAERLASMTARGVYHRSLSGLSVLQGSVRALEQEQPSWVEEREQVETRHDTGSSAPLQSSENAEDGEVLQIPGNLTERERLMLQTTQADREQGAVSVIKCRLCPKSRFGTWVTFQRHCKSCEKHPFQLRFCPKCGDYFGRPDSRVRHNDKKYREACINMPQDEARAKRQKVERLLEAFEARLKHCLRTGEEIGPRFSDIVTKKLTKTSKKVSKTEEILLECDSWAAGLC